jgi:uncharacterized membrane protein YvlD (DUF360 family)
MQILGHIVRFIVSAIVLMVVGWMLPNFTVGNFGSAFLFALVIAAIGWLVEVGFGTKITSFGRGIVGFLTSVVILWLAQFVVSGVSMTLFGAILAALIIGIIDLFMPLSAPFDNTRKETSSSRQ